MERIPQPIMDKRGEPHMKRFEDQRWVLDNIVRANGIDWDQPRSIYVSSPCGMEGQADIHGVRERVKKMADIAPAFEAVAVRREAKAKAAEEAGSMVTARDNYFMAAVYWGAAQWPYDQNDEENVRCHLKKRENYTKYAGMADHKIEAAWIPFKDTALPAWFHLPPNYSGGKIPVVINVPGMDSYKEISTALYGDRFLNRGFATLNIDGPGQYESPMLGIYFSMDNWVATGKAVCDWLAKRHELRHVLRHHRDGARAAHLCRRRDFGVSRARLPHHLPGGVADLQEALHVYVGHHRRGRVRQDAGGHDMGGARRQGEVPLSLRRRRVRRAVAGRALVPAGEGGAGAKAHCRLPGVAPFRRQRAGGESRTVPADPRRRLAR
jgi:FrsA-like alpha/beta hydrolase family protein